MLADNFSPSLMSVYPRDLYVCWDRQVTVYMKMYVGCQIDSNPFQCPVTAYLALLPVAFQAHVILHSGSLLIPCSE